LFRPPARRARARAGPPRRLNAQTPESTLTAQADYVLRNDSSLAHLQAAAEQLCTKLLAEGGAGKEL